VRSRRASIDRPFHRPPEQRRTQRAESVGFLARAVIDLPEHWGHCSPPQAEGAGASRLLGVFPPREHAVSTPEPRSHCLTEGCTGRPAWQPVLLLRHARRAARIEAPLPVAVCEACHARRGLAWYLREHACLYRAARETYRTLCGRTPHASLTELVYRAL
jgi:hypothetical protein